MTTADPSLPPPEPLRTSSGPVGPAPTVPGVPGWVENPVRDRSWRCRPVPTEVRDFHRGLPGYAVTALTELPDLARDLGVGRVFAKVESDRFGLPSFKALGASWAVHRALRAPVGDGPVTLVTATDGNHGRAVARVARRWGHRARIFLPDGVPPVAVRAIRDEDATVTHVPGSYDDAVLAAARFARDPDDSGSRILVQDTAWEGYEEIPGWIVEGYSTLFAELDDQLRDRQVSRPELVLVPTGVGSLLQAAVAHYRSELQPPGTAVVSVEPSTAAAVLAGVAAGRPVTVSTRETIMAGLNCGTVSTLAWPYLTPGLDACVSVTDDHTARAVRELAALGVPAGPSGAASLAGLRALHDAEDTGEVSRRRSWLGLDDTSTVVLLITEGTEPTLAPAPLGLLPR